MTFELSAIVQNTPPAVLAKALKNQGNCPLCNVGHCFLVRPKALARDMQLLKAWRDSCFSEG